MIDVLITGTKGFIGRSLYNKLFFNENLNIKTIDSEYLESDNCIYKLNSYLNEFKPNVVFHVGACSDTLNNDVNYMFIRNYETTKIISKWCYNNNSKLIYSSSAANYGINNLYPSNLYGWSKYAGEDIVHLYNGISLRYFNVYGPGEENKKNMSSVAHQMFYKYKEGKEVKLFPGKPSRDFVYIDDVVDANIFAFKNYDEIIKLKKQYFEVGSGESRTFEDVLNILGIPFNFFLDSEIPFGYQFYTKSNSEFWMPLWKPNYNIEMGLSEYKTYLECLYK